jgi:hypothetical protein
MRKFRRTKWGQREQLSDDEIDQSSNKDDRWTLRAGFVLAVTALMLAAVMFDRFYNH